MSQNSREENRKNYLFIFLKLVIRTKFDSLIYYHIFRSYLIFTTLFSEHLIFARSLLEANKVSFRSWIAGYSFFVQYFARRLPELLLAVFDL